MTKPLTGACLSLALLSIAPLSQAASPLEDSRPGRPGAPRWVEDYRFLDAPGKATDPFDGLRYHRLSDSAWLQLGAEARYRADAMDKPFFGLRGIKDDSYLMQRLQAHADLHLFDDALRAFVQVENTRAFGKDLYSPNDESRNEVRQAFIDLNHDFTGGRYTTRVGRQEMAYGNQVFVTYRDSPNIRQTFDGLRASLNLKDGRKLDAFAVRPVETGEDSWDDGSNNAVKFYGLYGTQPLTQAWNIDLFAFGLETDDRTLAGKPVTRNATPSAPACSAVTRPSTGAGTWRPSAGTWATPTFGPGRCPATPGTPSVIRGTRAWPCAWTPPVVTARWAMARSVPSTRCTRAMASTARPA